MTSICDCVRSGCTHRRVVATKNRLCQGYSGSRLVGFSFSAFVVVCSQSSDLWLEWVSVRKITTHRRKSIEPVRTARGWSTVKHISITKKLHVWMREPREKITQPDWQCFSWSDSEKRLRLRSPRPSCKSHIRKVPQWITVTPAGTNKYRFPVVCIYSRCNARGRELMDTSRTGHHAPFPLFRMRPNDNAVYRVFQWGAILMTKHDAR